MCAICFLCQTAYSKAGAIRHSIVPSAMPLDLLSLSGCLLAVELHFVSKTWITLFCQVPCTINLIN